MEHTPKILWVEDDPRDFAHYSRKAKEAFAIVHCDTQAAAERFLLGDGFDAAVVDLHLPNGHGVELVATIIGAAHGAGILVLTGDEDNAQSSALIKTGADLVLYKGGVEPCVMPMLIATVIEKARQREKQRAVVSDVLDRLADLRGSLGVDSGGRGGRA